MKNLLKIMVLGLFVVSCGRVERPEEFFDITGDRGKSCYSENLPSGVKVVCPNGSTIVKNGSDSTPIEFVEVCRNGSTSNYIETLIKLGNQFLASFSDNMIGENGRLALLVDGELYQTTDGRSQKFRVLNGQITCE